MERFVLDTSVFTNPSIYAQFGDTALAALATFVELARRSGAEFYMPGSVYDELRLMKDLDSLSPQLQSIVRIRSPRRFNLQIPASLLYEFIDEVRMRIDRGLRIAEEHTKMGREPGTDQNVGKVIGRLRERYRDALRQGIIDSREDADVLLLAYELDGVVVAADEGLRKWADKVGVQILPPQHLRSILEDLIEQQSAAQ
ncbi:MAG: RNA ligase partner protein [Gammaproteobacteria bacterium]